MLLIQYEFPDTYHETEVLLTEYSEEHARKCFKKHLIGRTGDEIQVGRWIKHRLTSHKKVFDLLIDILQADPNTPWTGYRVLG